MYKRNSEVGIGIGRCYLKEGGSCYILYKAFLSWCGFYVFING